MLCNLIFYFCIQQIDLFPSAKCKFIIAIIYMIFFDFYIYNYLFVSIFTFIIIYLLRVLHL